MVLGLDPRVVQALLLTSLGAAGTGLGGLLVCIQPQFNFKQLGYLQGLAGGLMLAISFFDLYPESVEAVGSGWASFWFFIGVAFFAVIVAFIPNPDSSDMMLNDMVLKDPAHESAHESASRQHEDSIASQNGSAELRRRRKSAPGSPNADTHDSPPPPRPPPDPGSSHPHPHPHLHPFPHHVTPEERQAARRKVLMSGLITALGIALHNFPEGVAVFLASIKSHSVGLSLAVAIAMHNVPEGVAVALPVYFATGSRLKGLWYAVASGLAEPASVVVLGVVFKAFWVDPVVVDCLLAAVGGIMAFLALHELLPLAMEHAGRSQAVLAFFLGMAIMAANLQLLETWMGDLH